MWKCPYFYIVSLILVHKGAGGQNVHKMSTKCPQNVHKMSTHIVYGAPTKTRAQPRAVVRVLCEFCARFKCTQNAHRTLRAVCTLLCTSCARSVRGLNERRPRANRTQIVHKMHKDCTQNTYRLCTEFAQTMNKNCTTTHKTHTTMRYT